MLHTFDITKKVVRKVVLRSATVKRFLNGDSRLRSKLFIICRL